MILVIDNYDSFTYNLVQYVGELSREEIRVFRNDEIKPEEVNKLRPSHIIISPGPKDPQYAGVSNEIIARFAPSIPTLGVCLWPPVHCIC
ncbi:MAG: hypothetical protein PWP60_1068 [Candidatus Atribacteria bacterium]|jgi:anthranilate/para-aminobenzoate synthase component II|uniref:glutamine amidotransferase-related protein n=1 Tax=Atribacterales TaxID=2847775 RepID=UPI0024AC7253|nr:hypothetical protein [Candidatus Atribacteria bacterium]MDI3531219.1 hypothetical protein [Candidatus Atribacteria bacterium]